MSTSTTIGLLSDPCLAIQRGSWSVAQLPKLVLQRWLKKLRNVHTCEVEQKCAFFMQVADSIIGASAALSLWPVRTIMYRELLRLSKSPDFADMSVTDVEQLVFEVLQLRLKHLQYDKDAIELYDKLKHVCRARGKNRHLISSVLDAPRANIARYVVNTGHPFQKSVKHGENACRLGRRCNKHMEDADNPELLADKVSEESEMILQCMAPADHGEFTGLGPSRRAIRTSWQDRTIGNRRKS